MYGHKLHSKGLAKRQITTLVGVIHFSRRTGRCPNRCRIGLVAPLDTQLQLAEHQRSGLPLQRLACLLAVFMPFETATQLLEEMIGISVSPRSVWYWVQNAGQRSIEALKSQLDTFEQGKPMPLDSIDPTIEQLPMLIGADGVMVPFRRQKETPKGTTLWREVKVAIVTRFRPRRRRNQNDPNQTQTELVDRRLVACLGSIDDLGKRLWFEAVRGGVTTAKQVVFISDGARGFWRLFETYFAHVAIGILDFYHAAQNLFKAVTTWLDGRTKKARGWFAATRHQLRHGPTMGVRMDIEQALSDPQLSDTSRKVVENFLNYLDTHHAHIQYHHFKAIGLPIGSGMVESACKWLIIQRFKGVGMRWSFDGFNALLHLRLAWVNNRFDDLFSARASPN